MLLEKQSVKKQNIYRKILASAGSISKLFSDSSIPYLSYRLTENAFCMSFSAKNLSRSDCSADAALDKVGVGIKTFINGNGKSLQKIAEFNKEANSFKGVTTKEVVEIISKLRNERIRVTKRIYGLDELIYHCIVREEGKILIFECPMDEIDIESIRGIDLSTSNTILFEDRKNEYSFNLSKSTLYKRFITKNILMDIDVNILNNPYEEIMKLGQGFDRELEFAPIQSEKKYVFLPLFSDRGGRHVPQKSGLNQWNASGRRRNINEVYIPIPKWIHNKFPDFFPERHVTFDLELPDGRILNTKVCQDDGKALMSNPNTDLGEWILRTVMNLEEGEILNYERLQELGIDSIVIYKENDKLYSINFTEIGSYDNFYNENK